MLLLAAVVTAAPAHAQRADQLPQNLKKGVGIDEQLGAELPLGLTFKNAEGETVQLGDYFTGDKPVLLTLNYFECPMLCTYALNGTLNAVNQVKGTLGEDFRLVTVSFNHREGPKLARTKRNNYIEQLEGDHDGDAWAFLTGSKESIEKLTDAVGFSFRWVEKKKQYAHTAAIMVVTPGGKLSRYLKGIQYDPKTLRLSMVEASNGKVGSVAEQALVMFCLQYNPETGEYTKSARKIMKAGGAVTILALAGTVGCFLWWGRRRGRTAP